MECPWPSGECGFAGFPASGPVQAHGRCVQTAAYPLHRPARPAKVAVGRPACARTRNRRVQGRRPEPRRGILDHNDRSRRDRRSAQRNGYVTIHDALLRMRSISPWSRSTSVSSAS